MDEKECMVLGCDKPYTHRLKIGKSKVLYVCEECCNNINHPEKNSVEKLDLRKV